MVSIIVPLFNYEQYIGENIQSILDQTYTDWQLIVVDDASTDGSADIARKYAHLDTRVKFVSLSENVGYSAAKNVGIRMSDGEYIVVLDADDMLTRRSLKTRLAYLDSHPKIKWVHARAYEFSGKPPYQFEAKKRKAYRRLMGILKSKDYTDLWKSMHAQTIMVRREVYEKVGLYDESFRCSADKEMWARIINHVGIPKYIPKFVTYYRNHSGQMHRSKTKLRNLDKIQRRLDRTIKKRKKNIDDVPRL